MFTLEIITPDGIIFNEEVDEVILPTSEGQITILPNHVPLYAKLSEGEAYIKKKGRADILYALLGGIVDVTSGKVSILSDYAVHADNIQIARAEDAKKRAEEAIANKEELQDFTFENKELRKSILELKVAQKMRKHGQIPPR
ncbi:MAG: ATP synthase F1 subunit epsilon [Candidatus Levyibacteriota bacterium]